MACLHPIFLRSQEMVVPCGKCPDCRNRRVQSWVFRLQQQEKIHVTSAFITLTYAPENLPRTPNGFSTILKTDFQKFMKRLRKNTNIKTIRYYACGEYGSQTWRPHYHAIIFDAKFEDIYKAWGLGQVHIGTTTAESIAYTTKYMCKKKKIPVHSKDDRVPEFSLMSKNLGKNYLNENLTKYFRNTQNSFVYLPGGFKQALPRYYRDRIFTNRERTEINKKAQAAHVESYNKAIEKAGGINNYYYNRKAAIAAAMKKFENDKSNEKRNKL